jgi:hypothetical protein
MLLMDERNEWYKQCSQTSKKYTHKRSLYSWALRKSVKSTCSLCEISHLLQEYLLWQWLTLTLIILWDNMLVSKMFCWMCSYIHHSRSRVVCNNSKNFEEWLKRSCEEFKQPVHQTLRSTFKRNKTESDKRNQHRLGMYNFVMWRNIVSKINTLYFNGIKYIPISLIWYTILVSFPDEFAVELMVVGHHPERLTSSVLWQAH